MSASDDTSGTKRPLRDGIDTVKTQVNDATHNALDKTREGLGQARETVSEVYDSGFERAADAYVASRDIAVETLSSARERLRAVAADATDGLEASPLVAVAGGIALGVLIGALLPRSEREIALYGSLGETINAAAKEAAAAARDAGRDKLADLGISRDHAGETVRNIIDAALTAATSAGTAAIDAASAKAKGEGA